jgi:pimeloyl-ACP methyl ester carboxylesterase
MDIKETASNSIIHRQVKVNNISVHLAETGNKGNQTILLLHGYPENWQAFEEVMNELKDNYNLLAIDLPGIGKSEEIAAVDTYTLAKFINDFIQSSGLKKIVLAGHDIGGMITYTFLKHFPKSLFKAIIMNTAIPGVEPWEEVKRNPYIWHFAFYSIPSLPETLITGKQRILFDYFYDTISANKNAISESKRNIYAQAYGKHSSLKTSFDWYRAFPQNEKINADKSPTHIPVLYLRGEKDFGSLEKYMEGFKKSGLNNIKSESIPGCGHFAPEEQPKKVAAAIHNFITQV